MTRCSTKTLKNIENTKFEVLGAAEIVELELFEVSPVWRSERQESFSLMLRGPLAYFLPQGTYRLRRPGRGEGELFVVSVGQDAEGFLYQAVFNRLIDG